MTTIGPKTPGVPGMPLPQTYTSYRWGFAPEGLATESQLRSVGLRPARRREPVAEISWRRGQRQAGLHRVDEAVEIQAPTEQQSAALAEAMRARKTCRDCGTEADYVLPTRFSGYSQCLDCIEAVAELGDEEADEDHPARHIDADSDEEDADEL